MSLCFYISIIVLLQKKFFNTQSISDYSDSAAKNIREIVFDTKTEVYEIAAESSVGYLKRLGLDFAEEVADDVDKLAATTCNFLTMTFVFAC